MVRRFIWSCFGIFFGLIGLVGLVLPIIPGILFLLLSAFCFAKSGGSDNRRTDNTYIYPGDSYRDDFQQLRRDLRDEVRGYRDRYRQDRGRRRHQHRPY